jgi:hypothetical protein
MPPLTVTVVATWQGVVILTRLRSERQKRSPH